MDLNITPVADQYKPMPTMSLGDMINVARGAQAYKAGNIELQKSQQANAERLALQNFMSNPDNYQTAGRIDIDKINAEVPKIAPYTGAEFINKMTTLGNAQTQAVEAKQNLTQEQRNMVASRFAILGRMGIKNKDAYLSEMDLLKKENPDNPDLAKLINSYKTTWAQLPDNANFPQIAIAGAQTLIKPEQQEAIFGPQASLVNTGSALQPVISQHNPGGIPPSITPGGGQPIPLGLAPGQRMQPTGRTDMNNNPTAYVFDQNGRLLGETTIPAGVQDQGNPQGAAQGIPGNSQNYAPSMNGAGNQNAQMNNMNAPARLRAGETPDTLQRAQSIRVNASNAATTVPMQLFNNNQIIKLADATTTGKGASVLSNLTGGYAALPWTSDNSSNLNQLGHYMALQTSQLAQSAGLGDTDAARSIAGQISGTLDWTPDAIKKTARVNRALATATEMFNQGVNNSFNKTKDPFSARDFQNQWSQVADIGAIQLYDAVKNNDKEGIRQAVNAVGGPKSSGYRNLVSKIQLMQRMIKGQ